MASFKCPYCGNNYSLDQYSTHHISRCKFGSGPQYVDDESIVNIEYCKCPTCHKYSIFAEGVDESVSFSRISLKPNSTAQQFPDYVPQQIRNDYEEACAILNLSPKASATLSRRCLQGMIHDFWNITEKNLNAEISSLKDKLDINMWNAIDAIRNIGNIGAHMEHDVNKIVDIEPDEASKLIKLIEFLIKEWYVGRHDKEQLLLEVQQISANKDIQRKS